MKDYIYESRYAAWDAILNIARNVINLKPECTITIGDVKIYGHNYVQLVDRYNEIIEELEYKED